MLTNNVPNGELIIYTF